MSKKRKIYISYNREERRETDRLKAELQTDRINAELQIFSASSLFIICIFLFSFILRFILIIKSPYLYSFDAYIFLMGLSSQYPLFTGLIKILISCGFSVFMIRVVIAVIASLSCIAFYFFSLRLFRNIAIAGVATLLMSIYPSFLVFSIVPYTESLFLLCFFSGLYFFLKEYEIKSSIYLKTGIFLGLACLTRYEGFLILPLIFTAIIIKIRPAPCTLHLAPLFKIAVSLFWSPVALIFYNYLITPELAASQSEETQNIFKELFPLLENMINAGLPNLLNELKFRDLRFPFFTLLVGFAIALIGCITAMFRDKKMHLIFICFILLSTAIQLLPIASNYRDYPGRIIGLRRHGMIPVLFLIIYLSYIFNFLTNILSERIKFKGNYLLILLILLIVPVTASYKGSAFLINDFQKLYRNSYIEPLWIGKPDDSGKSVIAAISNRILMLRLQGTGLKLHSRSQFENMQIKKVEEFIQQNQVKYVLIERDLKSAFDNLFMTKHKSSGFHQIAEVGGWLLVYEKL